MKKLLLNLRYSPKIEGQSLPMSPGTIFNEEALLELKSGLMYPLSLGFPDHAYY